MVKSACNEGRMTQEDSSKARIQSDAMERTYSSDPRNLAKELLKMFPDTFGEDFGDNKSSVGKFLVADSKMLRNEVAGQITRLKGREASGQLVSVPYVSTGNEGRKRRGRTRRR
jgi:ribosomal protein S17E